MMYSTFSVRDAVKTACPELVDTIYRRAPYKFKEAFDEIYDHWQHIYDTGEQWAKEPIAPSVPLTIKRSPDSDLTAQKAITAECDKELFALYLHIMCMDMPGNIVHGAAVAVNIFGTDDAHIHIAGLFFCLASAEGAGLLFCPAAMHPYTSVYSEFCAVHATIPYMPQNSAQGFTAAFPEICPI